MTLKSLAHPDWPYTNTPHEWRGFGEWERMRKAIEAAKDYKGSALCGVYQKQNFGPDLD